MNKPKCYSYIRFSSKKQEFGDSENRQSKRAEKYASDKGLELDRTYDFLDKGVSGFTGANLKEGKLGLFLALVEKGNIPPKSRLIIESIDRLGRQQPFEAIETIRKILKAGIMLVVIDWFEPKEYTYESIQRNPGEFSGLGREIERAYFESLKKSERIRESRKSEREKVLNGKGYLNHHAPMWIERIKDDEGNVIDLEVIPEIAESINRIFELKLHGYGNKRIAKNLNKSDKFWKPKKSKRNKTGGWAPSTIQRYLTDRRLIGECQLYKKVDGKREKVGEPVEGYFDVVVSKEQFFKVESFLKRRRKEHGHSGGRADKAKNLFVGTTKCGLCGSNMRFFDPGKNHGNPKLQCSVSREPSRNKDKNCKAKPIHYNHFMENFFKYCSELKASDILPKPDELLQEIENLENKIDSNGEQIHSLDNKNERLVKDIEDEEDDFTRKLLRNRVKEIGEERKQLIKENQDLIQRKSDLKNQTSEIEDRLDTLTEMRTLMNSAKNEKEAIEVRLKIRGAIQQIINRIEIYASTKHSNKYKRIIIWFKGSYPYTRQLTFKESKDPKTTGNWSVVTRNKAPKAIDSLIEY